jgi:Transglycosylase SLT domain
LPDFLAPHAEFWRAWLVALALLIVAGAVLLAHTGFRTSGEMMFVPPPHGALARACVVAAFLLAIFVGAMSRAQAHGRVHHHRGHLVHAIHASAGAPTPTAQAMPQAALGVTFVFGGREISLGAEPPRDLQQAGAFGVGFTSPIGGFSLAAGAADLARGDVAEIVRAKAEALGVPVRLALAITRYESGGRCRMRGRAGERGAMQVLPQTAQQVGVSGNLYDCATGIEAGVRYLALAMSMHAGAGWCAVASAYNSGTWNGSRCTHYGRIVTIAAGMR